MRGVTLVELIVALVLTSVIVGSVARLLTEGRRVHDLQVARADLNSSMRTMISVLPAELRSLDPTDPGGSDLEEPLSSASVTFRAMRGLFFTCRSGSVDSLVLERNRVYGLRSTIDVDHDSLLIFLERDRTKRNADEWIRANAAWVDDATLSCPGGAGSITVHLGAAAPVGLAEVAAGAPVRSFEMMRIREYVDVFGDRWIGAERFSKAGGRRGGIQPLFGPVADPGLRLTYHDSLGRPTLDAAEVRAIGLTLVGRIARRLRTRSPGSWSADTLVTAIRLRNGRKP